MTHVDSEADNRTINNAVRHQYRVLSDEEKAQMVAVKDKGLEFIKLIDGLRTQSVDVGEGYSIGTFSPGVDTAIQKAQEAVFWAVWHITGDK